jgi:competence protein ComEC
MAAIREAGLVPVRLRAGAKLRLDDRTTVEVLWPPAGRADLSANDASLVLRITCDGQRVLLPGDLDRQGLSALAAAGPAARAAAQADVRADVLVLPHHGTWRDTLPALVSAVGPKVVLASTAREPTPPQSGGQSARLFYQRLTGDYQFHSTLRDGWIQVRFGRGGIQVRSMRR